MSSDWWSKRLSGNTSAPKPATTSMPPTSPPIKIPPGLSHSNPPHYQDTTIKQRDVSKEPITMGEALRMPHLWEGVGEAARKQGNLTCPECGSGNVFIRTAKGGNTTINGSSPAPRCFECGWNGLYDQASQASWGV